MKKKLIVLLLLLLPNIIWARSVPYEYKGNIIKSTASKFIKPKADKNGIFLIWDFNEGLQNNLKGWGNPFQSGECSVEDGYSEDIKRGKNGRSLELIAEKKSACYCGYWFHLFNMKDKERKYLNISDYGYLSFFVKGSKGGEDVFIKVADEEWVKREDSVVIGPISDYIEGGAVSKDEWREVIVPISDFKIDIKKFGQVTFEFIKSGKSTLYIDDITLKKDRTSKVPKYGDNFVAKEVGATKKYNMAMWVWHPEDYQNPKGRKELINFCNEKGVNVLWCQALIKYYKETDKGLEDVTDEEVEKLGKNIHIVAKFVNPDADREFLEYAHKNGIKEIHLLDGYKVYVLEPFHSKMLAEVEATIEFNNKAKDIFGKWDGIHHDNEPYLLDGFNNPTTRQSIYKQYLDLTKKIMSLIKNRGIDIVYGCDIPFWFDEPDESLNFVGNARYNGVEKPVSFHLLDIVDNIGIMDYRNFAYGPDGTIAHGKDEIEYATEVGKKVYVGLETIEIEPQKITFYGKSEEYLNKVINQTIDYFKEYSGFEGMAIHYYRTYKELCNE